MSAINPRVYKASQISQILVNDKIKDSTGNITFHFLGTSFDINEKSAVGDLFQEWLAEYFRYKKIYFRTKNNTQEFPDFLLNPQSDHEDLLEIKTFDYNKAPNFDVANFESYCRSLKHSAYRLDANYLIFGEKYDSITWLKNVQDNYFLHTNSEL